MITAAQLADALPPGFVELVVPGEQRPLFGMEIVEVGEEVTPARGDLVTLVGATDVAAVLPVITACAEGSGLLLRRPLADDPEVGRRCAEVGLPLLGMVEGASLSSVLAVARSAIDAEATPDRRSTDRLHDDLFQLADRVSALLEAPVTIEDANSHVLAYSRGQSDVDAARTSTIVGRRVPREVRDHFRSLGVFRRLARSDAPFLVPAGAGGVKPRYIIPVRAGEWLGSIWAITENPVRPEHARALEEATELVALSLLRLRAQAELYRQVQLDQVRSAVRGSTADQPEWLEDGPWRVGVLEGPADLHAEARCQLWQALCRRRGWRKPVVADIDDQVYAVLRVGGSGPGTEGWLADLVRSEGQANNAVRLFLGTAVDAPRDLDDSRATATELASASGHRGPVVTVADGWPAIVLARALQGQDGRPVVSPLGALLGAEGGAGALVDTLEAVIDYWGEPQRAARSLGVHANTIRNRLARMVTVCPIDLEDPVQRLALRLEIARFRARADRTTP